MPTAEKSKNVQSPLGEDDLYVENVNEPPRVGTLMKMLPKETFNIDTPTSLFYFGVDFAAVAATMGFLNIVVTSDNYHSLPIWLHVSVLHHSRSSPDLPCGACGASAMMLVIPLCPKTNRSIES